MNGKLVIVSGSAGSGKGTVLKELFNMAEYKYSVSATTREPRIGEADGVDYYFMTREDFLIKINNGDMLEHAEYAGNFYGTPREPIEKMISEGYSVILEIEVIGALLVKEKFPEAILIFLSPPTYTELERRLRERGTETEEVIQKRLERAKEEAESIGEYHYFVINETGEQKKAAFIINCIAEAAKYKNTPRKDISREVDLILKTAEESKIDEQKAKKFLKDYFSC
jgi:guanylate kinase